MFSVALFGGTFDPVHFGHINTSLSVQSHFQFNEFYFIPCKVPTIKAAAQATPQQRIDMLHLAIRNYPQFKIDTREIERSSPSYMVETLKSIRENYQTASLTLIIGYDAFLSLPKWHQWRELLLLANILVINRTHYTNIKLPLELERLLQDHAFDNKSVITDKKAGLIQFYDAGHYDLSSSETRKQLVAHSELAAQALPKDIYDYIKKQGLYQ